MNKKKNQTIIILYKIATLCAAKNKIKWLKNNQML